MILVQKWPFFHLFFLGTIGQENVFYDILERKNAFLGYKNKTFKQWKNWHFPKGDSPWFWSKNGHFSNFFFWHYRPKKGVLRYYRKNIYKKRSKSRKIDIFPKGLTHGLTLKKAICPTIFLGIIGQENVFYDILKQRKLLSRL